jgi:hypothetical protein
MKKETKIEPKGFFFPVTRTVAENEEDMEVIRKEILSHVRDRSTYEKHLETSVAEWERCAKGRWELLKLNISAGADFQVCHVLMENYFQAAECLIAYQKALGRAPCLPGTSPKP